MTFITFEGGDGAGKSTQMDEAVIFLANAGHAVTRTREPGGTELGTAIRELLLHSDHDIDPRAEALLFAADRAHHVATVVRPALERGDIVVQDRYIDSSVAYQGASRGLNGDDLVAISAWASQMLTPDLTILIDLDPAVAAARRSGTTPDRIEAEGLQFQHLLRAEFLRIAAAEPDRIVIVDGRLEPQEQHRQIAAAIAKLLAATP